MAWRRIASPPPPPLPPPFPLRSMGHQPSKEQPSKESARLDEISKEQFKVSQQLDTLRALAAEEAAAGTPAAEGRHQARWDAAWRYYMQLNVESTAIIAYRSECGTAPCIALKQWVYLPRQRGLFAACSRRDRHTFDTCRPVPGSGTAAVAQREGRSLPLPDRTPPVCMPPLPEPEGEPSRGWVQPAALPFQPILPVQCLSAWLASLRCLRCLRSRCRQW